MSAANKTVNILLVDDQPANLTALESILAEIEVNVVKADSGREALRAVLDREFAAILLGDIETARLIRELDRSRETPIIFLGALSGNDSHVFRELGAMDIIFEPFQPEVLRARVSVFVELFRKCEAIKRLSRQNELILKAAAEGIFGVDLHGLATFVNPAAAMMIGRHPQDITGRDIHALLHPTCDVRDCSFAAALHAERVRNEVADTFFREDGTSFPVEFRVAPMHDESANTLGLMVTFRDVTDKRAVALAAENERRYREAEAQSRAKDNFLATLSHELRTPMTSILGWVQFLRASEYTIEELQEALQMIESSAKLQKRLIDDMLDVSRIVLGKFHVALRPTRLSEIVEAAVTNARPDATDRGVRLTAEIEPVEDLVEADATRMQQVIGNILSNAIKFTPSGKQVELQLNRVDSQIHIRIRDEGDGIDPKFLPHVFERLRQADGSGQRSGLGIGLAIARHIVDLHNGHISAESAGFGRGATFTVTLPVA